MSPVLYVTDRHVWLPARRVRNVATLQWEPSAMGHLGINVHARALAMECSNRGQVIWLAMMGKRAQVQPHEPGE